MNPLRQKQIKNLNKTNNADLARKVDEIVRWINNHKEYNPKTKKPIRLKIADNLRKLANWIAYN